MHLIKRGQIFAPMGRAHPLDAAAFLINQDRGVPAHRIAQIGHKPAQLIGIFYVAGKKDKAPGLGFGEKASFTFGKLGAFASEYIGAPPGHSTGQNGNAGGVFSDKHCAEPARNIECVKAHGA